MIHWHDRWFPTATGRLLGTTGTLINCAKAKQHREPNLAGAPRHHFDDTDVFTLEEYAASDVAARPATRPQARPLANAAEDHRSAKRAGQAIT